MIHVISPAKSLDFESKAPISDFTIPAYLAEAQILVNKLNKTSKKRLREMMSISEALADLNVNRYQQWKSKKELSESSKQAIFSFTGDVYQGLDASSLTPSQVEYAQGRMFILSGMYGVLKPLDVMEPYRLEMGTSLKVGRASNLYEFWKDKPTEILNAGLKNHQEKVLINLASNEYFKVVNKKKIDGEIISPQFKDAKNGDYKIISFYAKKARGLMSRYLIENKISHSEQLEGFDLEGYRYNSELSKKNEPVFTREENQQ